jgi:capsular polysaccharide biosynthesis protein
VFARARPIVVVIVGVAAAAGLAAAAVATAVTPVRHRADTAIVLQRGAEPLGASASTHGLARTFARLVETDTVAANVTRNLDLDESPSDLLDRVDVTTDGTALLRVRVEGGSATRAKQIAQELALVFTQLVKNRFAAADGASAIAVAVFDPAHALPGRTRRGWARNLVWGTVLGALVGAAVAPFRRRRA